MSAPALESSISTSSNEIRPDDLPETVLPQSLNESKSADVAAVINYDKGNLGGPALESEGNELGELTSGSDNDEVLENQLASESNALGPPTLDVNNATSDGLAHAGDVTGMAPRPRFTPRGRGDMPSVAKKFDPNDPKNPKNQRQNDKEQKKNEKEQNESEKNGTKLGKKKWPFSK